MLFDKFRKKKNTSSDTNEIFSKILASMNPQGVRAMFYGVPDQAAGMLLELKNVLFPPPQNAVETSIRANTFGSEEEKCREASMFYAQAWTRSHMGVSPGVNLAETVKEGLRHRFSYLSQNAATLGADVCFRYIAQHEPALGQLLLTGSNYVNMSKVTLPEGKIGGHSEAFSIHYRKAVQFFEAGRFPEAVGELKQCLSEEPDDTDARFEMVECYIHLGDRASARMILTELEPRIASSSDRARYLRRLGVIEIDDGNLDQAELYLKKSMEFEVSPVALQELKYIAHLRSTSSAVPDVPASAGREKKAVVQSGSEIPDALNATGFRFEATGAFGYVFRQNGKELCTVSKKPGPHNDYSVRGLGETWGSKIGDDTIVPGVKRFIINEKDNSQAGEIILQDFDEYDVRLTGSGNTIHVSCGEGIYHFLIDQKEAARIERSNCIHEADPGMSGLDVTPYFSVYYSPQLEERMLLAVLAFPALRF